MLKQFLRYYWKAETKYTIHSPFVYKLIEEAIEDDRYYNCFGPLQGLHNEHLRQYEMIEVTDLGAGSRKNKSPKRKISEIAKNAVSPLSQCRFLFRLINLLQPQTKLELGTSLGISTLYQYFPNTKTPLYTLEGCPNLHKLAEKNFRRMKADNIRAVPGNFDKTLPKVLKEIGRLDYVFIDGNHRKSPTLSYFEQCLEHCHKDSFLLLDDIHWSEEMEQAWAEIKKHPRVTLTIDLFHQGLVFLRSEQREVEHFTLIPARLKPWKMGFFATGPKG